jgi:acetylornithine deacetylase/succinyl-diaminopimelate desuccinylase family protein
MQSKQHSKLDVVEFLQRLIRIPSVNPTGNPGTMQTGEKALAEFLAESFSHLGASSVEVVDVLPGRPNFLARFPTDRAGKPRVLLAPHIDTVGIKGMTIDPFGGEIRDGRVYGRGSCDTKGTIAAFYTALADIGDQIPKLPYEIWFAGLMGEEAGNEGARALAADPNWRADFALIGEPTQCQIVNTHKGVSWLDIQTTGRACHSSAPECGDNAIYRMTEVIRELRDRIARDLEKLHNAALGSPTVNVGIIQGGGKINIVPDSCRIEVDFRVLPEQDQAELLSEVTRRVQLAGGGGEHVHVSIIRQEAPLYTDPDHPCIQALERAGGKCVGAPWFCDGSVLASIGGIPSVAAGPGDIAQAHTVDEWISIDQLHAGVAFYRRFLEHSF